jgi:hypothetical protein
MKGQVGELSDVSQSVEIKLSLPTSHSAGVLLAAGIRT